MHLKKILLTGASILNKYAFSFILIALCFGFGALFLNNPEQFNNQVYANPPFTLEEYSTSEMFTSTGDTPAYFRLSDYGGRMELYLDGLQNNLVTLVTNVSYATDDINTVSVDEVSFSFGGEQLTLGCRRASAEQNGMYYVSETWYKIAHNTDNQSYIDVDVIWTDPVHDAVTGLMAYSHTSNAPIGISNSFCENGANDFAIYNVPSQNDELVVVNLSTNATIGNTADPINWDTTPTQIYQRNNSNFSNVLGTTATWPGYNNLELGWNLAWGSNNPWSSSGVVLRELTNTPVTGVVEQGTNTNMLVTDALYASGPNTVLLVQVAVEGANVNPSSVSFGTNLTQLCTRPESDQSISTWMLPVTTGTNNSVVVFLPESVPRVTVLSSTPFRRHGF